MNKRKKRIILKELKNNNIRLTKKYFKDKKFVKEFLTDFTKREVLFEDAFNLLFLLEDADDINYLFKKIDSNSSSLSEAKIKLLLENEHIIKSLNKSNTYYLINLILNGIYLNDVIYLAIRNIDGFEKELYRLCLNQDDFSLHLMLSDARYKIDKNDPETEYEKRGKYIRKCMRKSIINCDYEELIFRTLPYMTGEEKNMVQDQIIKTNNPKSIYQLSLENGFDKKLLIKKICELGNAEYIIKAAVNLDETLMERFSTAKKLCEIIDGLDIEDETQLFLKTCVNNIDKGNTMIYIDKDKEKDYGTKHIL